MIVLLIIGNYAKNCYLGRFWSVSFHLEANSNLMNIPKELRDEVAAFLIFLDDPVLHPDIWTQGRS